MGIDFSAYKKPRQREYVIIALDAALRSISGPTPTIEIVELVRRSLAANADQKASIGRILTEMAPHVPEARRGETFKAYGRMMQRWDWWPKGSVPGQRLPEPKKELTREDKWRAMPRTTAAEIEAWAAEMYAITGNKRLSDEEDEALQEAFETGIWSA